MSHAGVRVECLDERQRPISGSTGSGFLRREDGLLYLYTAWHVVTGFDPHHVIVGFELPRRRYVRVALQDVREPQQGVRIIGGAQHLVVPLYANPTASIGPLQPLWQQNNEHIPHELLNNVGLFVPFWNDIIKIALPESVRISETQLITDDQLMPSEQPWVGDKCFIVGFPYGFSAAVGVDQPTPVVLTRFIASAHITGARKFEFFLDGYGAPGMSGGPVFLEREQQLYLIGAYTGDIFPDHGLCQWEKKTALGTVTDIRLMLDGAVTMTTQPSNPIRQTDSI